MAHAGHPFQAAVLEAAFPTLPEFWRHYPVPYAVLRAMQLVYPPLERRLRPIRGAAQLEGNPSVLLIHSDSDKYTPPSFGKRLRRAMQGRADVQMWTISEAGHTFAYRDEPEAYAERVVAFLQSSLAADKKAV